MICYGVVDALCSLGFGQVMKYTGRIPLIILGAVINYGLLIFMLLWKPNPDQLYVLFIMPVLWGISDAVWQTQING